MNQQSPEEHVNGEIGCRVDAEEENGDISKFGVPSLEESRWGSAVYDLLIDGAETVWRLRGERKMV